MKTTFAGEIWTFPNHPFRVVLALILAGIAGAAGNLIIEIVLMAGALKLLWRL